MISRCYLLKYVAQLREIYRLGQMIIEAGIASAPDIIVLAISR